LSELVISQTQLLLRELGCALSPLLLERSPIWIHGS
jgi:hypothetical protein